MLVAPMVACNIIEGTKVALSEHFQTWTPQVPEELTSKAFYHWIPVFVEKMKRDLVCAGVWEHKYL